MDKVSTPSASAARTHPRRAGCGRFGRWSCLANPASVTASVWPVERALGAGGRLRKAPWPCHSPEGFHGWTGPWGHRRYRVQPRHMSAGTPWPVRPPRLQRRARLGQLVWASGGQGQSWGTGSVQKGARPPAVHQGKTARGLFARNTTAARYMPGRLTPRHDLQSFSDPGLRPSCAQTSASKGESCRTLVAGGAPVRWLALNKGAKTGPDFSRKVSNAASSDTHSSSAQSRIPLVM